VQVGEMLASRDSVTGEPRFQPVRARMIREAPQVMRLTVKDEAGALRPSSSRQTTLICGPF
jgi:hypothetical protein